VALNIETLGQEVAYPTVLRDMGVQGLVLIKVRVDETGSITQAEVVSTPNPALAENCLRALPRLRFQPAVVDGTPTATWVTIPFRFQL
jgi:TonB family protein